MFLSPLNMVVLMLLFPAGDETENPWKDKVPAAVKQVGKRATLDALREALDVTWRADDWRAGLNVAERALKNDGAAPKLRGMIVRALWRAGRIEEAERLASKSGAESTDRAALRMLIVIHLARGEDKLAGQAADRLEKLGELTADDLYHVFAARMALKQADGQVDLLRKAEKLAAARNGYPDNYIAESIEGVASFLEQVGPKSLNQIARYGAAPLSALVLFNLPSCDVLVNGHGPYRMVIDTGGSIMLALDQTVADEIGLKSIATASVRGVSGKQETGQALVEELQIGTIACRRVITRIFDVKSAIMGAADGIIGTGMFGDGRMTLDFATGQLIVSPSGTKPGPGQAVELRLVGDAKLMTPVKLAGQPAMALLDTGADVVAMSPSRLKELFPDQDIPTFNPGLALGVGAGQTPSISLGPGVDLVVGGRKFDKYGGLGLDVLDNVLSPVIGVQTDILVGMPLFREMKSCTVDFPRCKMWVDWLRRD